MVEYIDNVSKILGIKNGSTLSYGILKLSCNCNCGHQHIYVYTYIYTYRIQNAQKDSLW